MGGMIGPLQANNPVGGGVAALLPASVSAKNLYKFQDKNGIWHFTDQAPDEDVEFSTVYMEREPDPRIRLRQDGKKESPVYILFNDSWGPAEVELTLEETVNVLTEPSLPAGFQSLSNSRSRKSLRRNAEDIRKIDIRSGEDAADLIARPITLLIRFSASNSCFERANQCPGIRRPRTRNPAPPTSESLLARPVFQSD